MKDIQEKITKILASSVDEIPESEWNNDEVVEEYNEYDYEEYYSDIFVLVKNVDQFYKKGVNPKASLLLESFLTEAMLLLKKDPDNIVVESGEYYVRATSFTPSGDVLMYLFEDAVLINTMLEQYNLALEENRFPEIETGIGIASFIEEDTYQPEIHDHFDLEEGEEHHHHDDDKPDYGIDFADTAFKLAQMGNTDELETIVVNDIAFEFLYDVDESFFQKHLDKAVLEDGKTIYHGNIVSDED